MSATHTYRGWQVTTPGARPVHFSDNPTAVRYWAASPAGAELTTTLRDVPCGVPIRGFCGHCSAEARAFQV